MKLGEQEKFAEKAEKAVEASSEKAQSSTGFTDAQQAALYFARKRRRNNAAT